MPPHIWATDRMIAIHAIEARGPQYGEAGALLQWSAWAVDSLYYLSDLDERTFAAERSEHHDHVIDASHLRWATSTAITALDLCAAVLGRVFAGVTGDRELSLRDLELGSNPSGKTLKLRAQLPAQALAWVDAVSADPNYKRILDIRHPMTHARVIRTVTMSKRRVEVTTDQGPIPTRDAIVMARDLATRHVEALLATVPF